MNAEEKTKLDKMENNVETINISISEIKSDMLEIKSALLGNNLSGDLGLKGRIDIVKAKQEILETQIKELQTERVKNTVYVKIITWLLSIIGALILAFLFDIFKIKTI